MFAKSYAAGTSIAANHMLIEQPHVFRKGVVFLTIPVSSTSLFPLTLNRSTVKPETTLTTEFDTTEKLKHAELVGRGFTADVYGWGTGRVLKLFHSWVPHERAEREYQITLAVHKAGLPVPEPYEWVRIEDRCGVVFERVDGISMLAHFQRTPWRIFAAIRHMADLQVQVHATPGPPDLPSQRDRLATGIAKSTILSAPEKEAARAELAKLPDGTATCHGDFHPENILFTSKGPMVIDWSSGSRGEPLGDVACTARLIQVANLPSWTPGYMHFILKCTRVLLHRAYIRRMLRHYGAKRQQLQKWELPLAAAATFWRVPEVKMSS